MANRKDFMINALIDVILDWTQDSKMAIQEAVDKGIQPNELLGYFDANTIVEALSDNETPPEIAAIKNEAPKSKVTAKTVKTTEKETDLALLIRFLEQGEIPYNEDTTEIENVICTTITTFDAVDDGVSCIYFEDGTLQGYGVSDNV